MSACKIEKEVVLHILIKKSTYIISYINLYIYIYICKSATIIVHLCMIIVDLHLIFHYFFSLLHLTFFFSPLWHLSLSPHSSRATDFHCSLATTVPPPITSLAEALTNHRSSCRSPLHSLIAATFFFLCLMVLGFWSMSFDDFD